MRETEPAEDIDASALTNPPQPSFNGSTCNQFGTIFSNGNVYHVMNNVFFALWKGGAGAAGTTFGVSVN